MSNGRVILFCVVALFTGFLLGTEYQKKSTLSGYYLVSKPGDTADEYTAKSAADDLNRAADAWAKAGFPID